MIDGIPSLDRPREREKWLVHHIRGIEKARVIGTCEVLQGDCMEIMPHLDRVSAVVTDPPYGLGEGKAKALTRGKLAEPRQYVGTDGWDDAPISPQCIAMMREISDQQIIFGGNYFEGLGPTSCWLVWDKLNGDNDFADCELAWTNLPKAVRRIRLLWNGFNRVERDEPRQHPTQKPVRLMQWCLRHLSPDTTSVLDPFLGSGSTLVACAKVGLHGIGIERDPEYFAVAVKRLEEADRQPDLFAPEDLPKPTPQEAFVLDSDAE